MGPVARICSHSMATDPCYWSNYKICANPEKEEKGEKEGKRKGKGGKGGGERKRKKEKKFVLIQLI